MPQEKKPVNWRAWLVGILKPEQLPLGHLDHIVALERRIGTQPGEPLGLGDRRDLLSAVFADHVIGRKAMLDVNAELVLAGVLGQVADMPVRGQHAVAGTEVTLDRPRLGR